MFGFDYIFNHTRQGHAMLHLQNVSVTFPPDVRALDNVNLQFRQGQFTVLLGQSGAGKSTLLRCLNLLQSPTQGLVVGDDDQCLSGLNKRGCIHPALFFFLGMPNLWRRSHRHLRLIPNFPASCVSFNVS